MECIIEVVFDTGSLYCHFEELKERCNPRGLRYRLAYILAMIALAKICGEDTTSRIAN